jgi:hypothetical protein
LSTETYARIMWVVLDGFGHEHARRFLETPGRFPALERIAREGYLGPCRPSEPVCQTPTALTALFTGAGPRESGVWGYKVPDPQRLERSISGFSIERTGGPALWDDLESAGVSFSILNVAFRRDPIWSKPYAHLAFAYDGYRNLGRPLVVDLAADRARFEFRGIEIETVRRREGVDLRHGGRLLAHLAPGADAEIVLTRDTRAYAHLLTPEALTLFPESPAVVRFGPAAPAGIGRPPAAESFRDMSVFRRARRLADAGVPISVAAELAPSRAAVRQQTGLARWAFSEAAARCTICYLPLVDEASHSWIHAWESRPAEPRADQLFVECASMIDGFLADLMATIGPDTLLVLSSDHGALPFRRMLHVNEAFADAGLVRRAGGGYDWGRSAAWYHPSDCGQVVVNEPEARRRGLSRPALAAGVRAAVETANRAHGAHITAIDAVPGDPFLLQLYPEADTYLTGDAPSPGKPALNPRRSGGHHLGPLTPSPWIDALLGLWSPREGSRTPEGAPRRNIEVKDFLSKRLAR